MSHNHRLEVAEDYKSIACGGCGKVWHHTLAGFGDIFLAEDTSWMIIVGAGTNKMGVPQIHVNGMEHHPKSTKVPITEE